MKLIEQLLPRECYVAQGANGPVTLRPQGLIYHFMSGIDAWKIFPELKKGTYDIFDPLLNARILQFYKTSAHIFIARDGTPYLWVPLNFVALHAGASILNGRRNCNYFTVGIEFASTGETYQGEPAFTAEQLLTGQVIGLDLMAQHKFPVINIAGHDQVRASAIKAGIRKANGDPLDRKPDPGPNFPWTGFLEPFYTAEVPRHDR